tara:strand:+ start:362 stop:625 length:264 start_codon:yes stop_codon:yes gene_type:complete
MSNISRVESMKLFWKNNNNKEQINSKRSKSLKHKCIWIKKNNQRPQPCNIEFLLSKICDGYLIVDTECNRNKVDKHFGEIPDFFYFK